MNYSSFVSENIVITITECLVNHISKQLVIFFYTHVLNHNYLFFKRNSQRSKKRRTYRKYIALACVTKHYKSN